MKRMLFLLTLLVSIAVTGRPANAQVKQAGEALEKQSYDEALRYVDEALRAKLPAVFPPFRSLYDDRARLP